MGGSITLSHHMYPGFGSAGQRKAEGKREGDYVNEALFIRCRLVSAGKSQTSCYKWSARDKTGCAGEERAAGRGMEGEET